MTPETAKVTIKNPRWWVSMPLIVPVFSLWLAIGWLLCRPLWWIGQAICRLSNALSPHATTPAPLRSVLDWVRRGAST